MRVIDFIDPRTDLNSWDNFKELSTKQKAITLLVSAVAAAVFLGYGGFVAFRALVHHFSKVEAPSTKIENLDESILEDQAEPIKPPVRTTNTDIGSMVEWK